jgi:hypothetical protein
VKSGRENLLPTAVPEGRTSETSVDNHFARQYITEDNPEQHMNNDFLRR